MAYCASVKKTSKWRETHTCMVWYLYTPWPKSATTSAFIKEHKSLKRSSGNWLLLHLLGSLSCVCADLTLFHNYDGRILGVPSSVRVDTFLQENKNCQKQRTKRATMFVPLWRRVVDPKGGGFWNFALFPSHPKFHCVLSLGDFSLNFGGVWSAATLQRTLLGYLAIVWSASGPALVMTASNAQPLQWALSECTKTDFTWMPGLNVSVLTQGGASTTMSNMKLTCGGIVVKKLNGLCRAASFHGTVKWCSVTPGEPRLHLGYSAVSLRTQGRLQLCQNSTTMEPQSPWTTGERKAKTVKPLYALWLCRKPLSSQKPNICKLVIQVGSRRCWNIRGYPWNITLLGFAAAVLPRPLPCTSGEMLRFRLVLGQWLTTFVDGGGRKSQERIGSGPSGLGSGSVGSSMATFLGLTFNAWKSESMKSVRVRESRLLELREGTVPASDVIIKATRKRSNCHSEEESTRQATLP